MSRNRKQNEHAKALESKLYIIRTSEDEFADLSECGLQKVPTEFYNLCRVFRKEIIDLHSNNLCSLSASEDGDDESMCKMKGILKEVRASKNLLRIFPRRLLSVNSLIILDLSFNQLTDLPDDIDSLNNLECFNLKANHLQTLPGTIGNLIKLRSLDISSNAIRKIPYEISKLKNLHEFHFDTEIVELSHSDSSDGNNEWLRRFMTNSPLSTTSNEQSISCDNDATDHCESQLVTTSKNSSDDCQYNNNNNELIVTDKHFNGYDQDEDVLTIDMERLNCERQMKMEQLMKEQEELDVLVEKVFAKHARDRMNMADTIKQMESHAESIIDNALNVLLRSSSNSTTAHDLDQEELDAVLRQRRIDLQNEREQWLKTTEQEDKLLSECVSNEAEERRRKSMKEIAKKMAEVDLLVLSKSGKEREKYDVICSEIMNDHNILEDFVVSMRERADERSVMLQSQIDLIERALLDISLIEMNRRNEKVDTNARHLADERHRLSMLYEQYVDERDFRRKQLFALMRDDLEKEEDARRRIATEYLRKYAELMMPPESQSPQTNRSQQPRRSVSRAERFGRFMAIFGRKRKNERTASPKKLIDYDTPHKKKEECSSETSTATTSQLTPSSGHRSIIRAHYEEECVVCMSNSVKLLISPCGHVCLCEECATSLDDCPMCRTRITNRILLSGTN